MSAWGTLFRYEIRMLLRDTRTILIAVVAPLVIFPVMIVITNIVEERDQRRLEEATYSYAVTGARAAWADSVIVAALLVDPAPGDTTRAPVRFERRTVGNPDSLLAAGELSLVVVGLSDTEWRSLQEERKARADSVREARRAERGQAADDEEDEAREAEPDFDPMIPALQLKYRGRSDFSRTARTRMQEHLTALRTQQRDSIYRAAGFPVALSAVASVEDENVATAAVTPTIR